MPVTIKVDQIKYKNGQGQYIGANAVSERTTAEQVAAVQAAGASTISEVEQAVSDSQAAVDSLESQKNTIAQTVASMAQLGTDTTLTTPGMAADAKATGDECSALKSAFSKTTTGIIDEIMTTNPNGLSWTKGNISSANGNTSSSTNRIRTDFITPPNKISPVSGFKFGAYVYDDQKVYQGIFDDGTYKKTGLWFTEEQVTISIPKSWFIRIVAARTDDSSSITADDGQNILFGETTDKTLTKSGKIADAKITGDYLLPIVGKMGRDNLFNKNDNDIVVGQYIYSITDGVASWTTSQNYSESGFIPVVPGDKIAIFNADTGTVSTSIRVARFDAEKTPVSVISYANANNYYAIPDDIYFIRFPFSNSAIGFMVCIKLSENDVLPFSAQGEPYAPYGGYSFPYLKTLIEQCATEDEVDELRQEIAGSVSIGSQWDGKSWYAYGTSLTNIDSEGKYAKYVRDFSGLVLTNKGISGGGICNNTRIKDAVMNVTDGKLNADLITLEVGANDTTAPLGTIYDTGDSTFCGALNQCIRYLQENTSAQIVVISSTNGRKNSGGTSAAPEVTYGTDNHTKFDQWEATRKVCEINSCYYIPMGEGANMSWARMNASNLYNVDNIHHTELGGYNLGLFVWYQLRNIPCWYAQLPT